MPRTTVVIVMLALLGASGLGLVIGYAAGGPVAPLAHSAVSPPVTGSPIASPSAIASPVASPRGVATPVADPSGGTPVALVTTPQASSENAPATPMAAAGGSADYASALAPFAREPLLGSPIVAETTIPPEATSWPTSDGTDGAGGSVPTAPTATSIFQRAGVADRGER